MHLDPAIGRDAHIIIARMDNIFIKLIDLMLVICVLYHGAYGLTVICKDYIPSQRIQAVCTASIVFIMGFFAWLGVKLIVLI
jgi:succinate dehydrogenase hydrophobic anchor subunit